MVGIVLLPTKNENRASSWAAALSSNSEIDQEANARTGFSKDRGYQPTFTGRGKLLFRLGQPGDASYRINAG